MLQNLFLRNYRNYDLLEIEFNSPVNIFIGDNGQGKTNLLEAIYFLSYLRTFRENSLKNIRKIGKRDFSIAAKVQDCKGWVKSLEIDINEKKILKIDGCYAKKSSDFIMSLKPVIFKHDDIDLITGGASLRRKFIDLFISSIDQSYLLLLKEYYVALSSRNSLLRLRETNDRYYKSFEIILAEKAEKITKIRIDIISKLSKLSKTIISDIKETDFKYELVYNNKIKTFDNYIDAILKQYENERTKDLLKGFTSYGPHMDDVEFIFENKNLRNFGSVGQCRIVTVCTKMAMMEILLKNTDYDACKVIALVDDVTGELDRRTKAAFFKMINKVKQVFITMTKREDYESLSIAKFYHIHDGIVSLMG